MKSNALPDKLRFVLQVVEQWIVNDGLGKLDEAGVSEKLGWEGPAVRDGARKGDRVTVGRCGGDDSVRQTA